MSLQMGGRVRALRRREGLTQADFAARLGISTSYLNLIENDRRPLSAQVLIKLARAFDVDLESFSEDAEEQLVREMSEVFADPMFEDHALANTELREVARRSPGLARATIELYARFQQASGASRDLAERLSQGQELAGLSRLPSEEVTDFIQAHRNHFPGLEREAEGLRLHGNLEYGLREALQRHDVRVVIGHKGQGGGAVRRYLPDKRRLWLSEVLPPRSRNFNLAAQLGLLQCGGLIDDLVGSASELTGTTARRLAKVTLANYFAGAVLMPYGPFLRAAQTWRYDLELLGNRFRTSFEQVAHRLTSLQRPGNEGVPFHFVRVDVAGNISKRFSASGIRFARFGSGCSKWNVFSAFMTPDRIVRQVSRMHDGQGFFCIARTLRKGTGGFLSPHPVQAIGLGCALEHAGKLVYSDGINLGNARVVHIGTSCRTCPRMDCEQRAFPSLERPLEIDENVRGATFFSGVRSD